ncbi:Uncharacterised protein [Collinsella intestinalis]|nr:Uncharacterised protein [Collinsella intestinalis]
MLGRLAVEFVRGGPPCSLCDLREPRVGDKRKPGAEKQGKRARVRSVVDAARIGSGVVEDRHLDGGDRGEGEGGASDAALRLACT